MMVEYCPVCVQVLPEDIRESALVTEMHALKEIGLLNESLRVGAYLINNAPENNPAILLSALKDQSNNLISTIKEYQESQFNLVKTNIDGIITLQEGIKESLIGKIDGNATLLNGIQEYLNQQIEAFTNINTELLKFIKSLPNDGSTDIEKIMNEINKIIQMQMSPIKSQYEKLFGELLKLQGSPRLLGKIQEKEIITRLSSLKTGGDIFSLEKSYKSYEDILCIVKENNQTIDKIVIESKRTKKWDNKYVEQVKKYMKEENTDFGVLVTKSLPSDALNNTLMRDGVLIITPEHLESAYIHLRLYVIAKKELALEYKTEIEQYELRDQILEDLRRSIERGDIEELLEKINSITNTMDESVTLMERYLESKVNGIRKNTEAIRNITYKIINDHLENVKSRLLNLDITDLQETVVLP